MKFIFDVSSAYRCQRAASSDSVRWLAMSGSKDSSYCFSKSRHSSFKRGVYVGRKPREWNGGLLSAYCIAPQKRWYDSSTLMLLTGIRPQSSSSVRLLPVHGFGSVLVLHIFCLVSSSLFRFFQNEGSSSVRVRFYSHLYFH